MDQKYVRLTDLLMNCWNVWSEDGAIPPEARIDPEMLLPVWDECFLVQVLESGRFRYDYLGKSLIEAYGEDYSQEEVDSLVSPHKQKVVKRFDEVVKRGIPLEDEGEFRNSLGLTIKYRQLLLPFSGSSGRVEYVLGGMRWKAF